MGLSWRDAKFFYNKLADNLKSKYGSPFTKEKFSEPYFDGDGYEEQALEKGKLSWSKSWPSDVSKPTFLNLSISDFFLQKGIMSVNLIYQSEKHRENSEKEETEDLEDL